MGLYNRLHAAVLTLPMPAPVRVQPRQPHVTPAQLSGRLSGVYMAAPAPARLGQGTTTLTLAQRNDILTQLAIGQAQAAYVQAYYNAHLNDLAIALGDKYASWQNWWDLQLTVQAGAVAIAAKLAGQPNPDGTWVWTSQEEGAYSGWVYAISQLADIVATVTGTPKPTTGTVVITTPPIPTTTTTTTTTTTSPAGAQNPLVYVGLGAAGLVVLGVGGRLLGVW